MKWVLVVLVSLVWGCAKTQPLPTTTPSVWVITNKAAMPVPVPKPTNTIPIRFKEVWLFPSGTNALGSGFAEGVGSPAIPLVGDYDMLRRSMPPYTHVHLMGGDYWSAADWDTPLKQGQVWEGAGIGITTIHRDPRFHQKRDQSLMWSYDNGIQIKNMSLDANGQPGDLWQRNGIDLFGSYNLVDGVDVQGATGNWTNHTECFPIFVGNTSNNVANIVRNCWVHDPAGRYITAISVTGQVTVENCRVDLPQYSDQHFACFQGSWLRDALFLNNTAVGGDFAYYSDTGMDINFTLAFNNFDSSTNAIFINKAPNLGWFIKNYVATRNIGAVDMRVDFLGY